MNVFLERVLNYCDDILSVKINACVKHKWAIQRFLNMYEKSQNSDHDYYFDWDVLEDFYYWTNEFRHTEGILAGQRVELTDFQLFKAAGILCFKKHKNHARLVRRVYIQLGRKNAKSQFEAFLGSYIVFLDKEKQRMYIAGWTREQSDEVYLAVKEGLGQSKLLDGKWREAYGKIEIFSNHSVIVPLSKETRKTGDGKNPSVAIIDEYHVHDTSEIYDVMDSGMGARREPLLVVITTAGFNMNSPCVAEYGFVSRLLNPDIDLENDTYFGIVCELDEGDDIKDETNWIKANPILATYDDGIESIRSALVIALEQPEKMRSLLTKWFNIWVDHKPQGYMRMIKWNEGKRDLNFLVGEGIFHQDGSWDLSNWHVYLGTDLSSNIDLTSIGLVAVKDGKYFVWQHSFMPANTFSERMSADKVRYDVFRDQGFLELTDGDVVDYRFVKKRAKELGHSTNVIEHGYDKWNAGDYAQALGDEQTMVEIPQRVAYLSTPTKRFREEVYQGNVYHAGDPLLQMAINNAICKTDDSENIKLSKEKSHSNGRIDPIAAVINAFARAMLDPYKDNLEEHILSDDFCM